MNGPITTFCVLLDAGVPDSVGAVFAERGHKVIFHRDILPEKTPDVAVCKAAIANNAILVGVDGDLKQFPKKYGISKGSDRFPKLSLIRICVSEVRAASRLGQCLSFIEHEWDFTLEKAARRLWVDVEPHRLTSHR